MIRGILVLAAAMSLVSCDAVHAHVRAATGHGEKADKSHVALFVKNSDSGKPANMAGKWQMTIETPHGVVSGPLEVAQEGGKLTATWATDHGSHKIVGTIARKKVGFSMDAPGGQGTFGFSGELDAAGKKMSGLTDQSTPWSATR